jgi:uncharacterized phage protein (TIGR01671 family)
VHKVREIKYRAWDLENKELVRVKSIVWFDGELDFIDVWSERYGHIYRLRARKKPRFILIEYTGLKDKNGEEIYEGDIVKSFDEAAYFSSALRVKRYSPYQIRFMDGAFWLYSLDGDEDNAYLLRNGCNASEIYGSSLENAEVIGNIYENPESLER